MVLTASELATGPPLIRGPVNLGEMNEAERNRENRY